MQIISNGQKYADNNIDIKNKIITFDNGDMINPTAPAEMPLVESGHKVSNLMRTISHGIKNVRYLLKILGTTDISPIGDGTLTGAISALNTSMTKIIATDIHDMTTDSYGQAIFPKTYETIRVMSVICISPNYAAAIPFSYSSVLTGARILNSQNNAAMATTAVRIKISYYTL